VHAPRSSSLPRCGSPPDQCLLFPRALATTLTHNCTSRQRHGQGQAQFVVVRPPREFHPPEGVLRRVLLLGGQRQQRRRTPSPTGQAPLWQSPEGLILPDDRLIVCGMRGILGLDLPGLLSFLPAQFRSGGDIGDEDLTERLHTLAVERRMPPPARLWSPARGRWR
jgi:hypothetical protein